MNAVAHDNTLYTSDNMKPKGVPPKTTPETTPETEPGQETQPPPETKADAQNPIIRGGKVPILLKNSEFFSRAKPFAF
jgi:hypothetical protein